MEKKKDTAITRNIKEKASASGKRTQMINKAKEKRKKFDGGIK